MNHIESLDLLRNKLSNMDLIKDVEKTELERNNPSIDFGVDYKNSKEEFFAFSNATYQLKSIVDDPDYYISEYFLNLRTEADLERELSKKKIDDHYDDIIEDLTQLEKKCKSKKTVEKYEEMIKQFEKDLKIMKDGLNIPKIDLTKWSNIESVSMSKTLKVNSTIEQLKIDLFNNKSLSIQSIQDELEELLDEDKSLINQVRFVLRACVGDKCLVYRVFFSIDN